MGPLSRALNGWNTHNTPSVTHAGTPSQLNQLINIVEPFPTDIRMESALEKRRTLNIRRGKVELEDFETKWQWTKLSHITMQIEHTRSRNNKQLKWLVRYGKHWKERVRAEFSMEDTPVTLKCQMPVVAFDTYWPKNRYSSTRGIWLTSIITHGRAARHAALNRKATRQAMSI